MSFSQDVKQELSKISNLANKDLVKIEFVGYCKTSNVYLSDNMLRFSTENEYNINRFAKLLNNIENHNYQIEMQGKNYVVTTKNKNILKLANDKDLKIDGEMEEKAYIRGCFLGSGSINNPENKYHIEVIFKQKQDAQNVVNMLKKYSINFKILEKENSTSIYSKDGEEISKFLAFIGANNAVLKFEEIRVYRDMRNNVNRIVNCETANLSKTVTAALKQIDAINVIKASGKFNALSESLKEIAELRIKYPEASLTELGEKTNPKIGRSGVNHRLKAIMKLAEE